MSTVDPRSRDSEPRSRSERAALSDKRLIQAALELIAEAGIERVTLRLIGERAGYSRGLVNYRFGTKETLLREATKQLVQNWINEIQLLRDGEHDGGLAAIEHLVGRHRQSLLDNRSEARAYHALLYSALGPMPELRQELAQVHAQTRQEISSWIRDGIHNGEIRSETQPLEAAAWIDAAVRGIAYQWYMDPEAIDVEQTFSELLTAIRLALVRRPS